jgi:hypothetical protein
MLNYTRLKMRISLNHSNLLGPCATYEENKVFENITPGFAFARLYFLHNLLIGPIRSYVKLHRARNACQR